ncbi:hypothetical protein HK405_001458, partial [Cladochytrium tenue]
EQITWVQPRVLDLAQIRLLKQRIGEWGIEVKRRVVGLEAGDETGELFLAGSGGAAAAGAGSEGAGAATAAAPA